MAKSILPPENIFSALPPELSRGLFANAGIVSLEADQSLFLGGHEADGCYRVEEGLLKASIAAPYRGERILAIVGPGAVVGVLSMIDRAPRSASVSALRDSKLCFVSRGDFEAFAQSAPEVYQQITAVLAQRLRDANAALVATCYLSVKGRVAYALLSLAKGFGKDLGNGRILICQKVSQSDLAAMAGIARENVSRVLKDWTARSLMSRVDGYYCLQSKAGIARELEL
jgi:CRP-like cAMP-binding protein